VAARAHNRRPPVSAKRVQRDDRTTVTPQLTMTATKTARSITVTLVGALDLAVEVEAREFVASAVAELGITALHIDATRVTFIGSSGLRTLILARQAALDHELTFTLGLTDPGPVQRLVTLFGLRGLWSNAS
jgi:anti-anti-sigma factor